MKRGSFFLLFCFILLSYPLCAEEGNASERTEALLQRSEELQSSDPDSSMKLAQEALSLAPSENLRMQAFLRLSSLYYWKKEDFEKTQELLDSAARFIDRMDDEDKAYYYGRRGDLIYYEGDPVRSIESYYRVLEFADTTSSIAGRTYYNLGWVYSDLQLYDKAIRFGKKGLRIREERDEAVTQSLGGLVEIFLKAERYEEALRYLERIRSYSSKKNDEAYYYYLKARLFERKGDPDSTYHSALNGVESAREGGILKFERINLRNAAVSALRLGAYEKASAHFEEYRALCEETGMDFYLGVIYKAFGRYHLKEGEHAKALSALQKGVPYMKKAGHVELGGAYALLAELFEQMGNSQEQVRYQKRYIAFRDSMRRHDSIQDREMAREQLRMYEMEKDLATKDLELEKERMKLEKERVQGYMLFGGLGLSLLFAFFILQRFRVTRRKNRIIQEQRDALEARNELVEEKNREILDSIDYARRLQEAILPPFHMFRESLGESFVLYKPKDIVAGDFYWLERSGDRVFFAAADCTGHGVPGALVSVICSNALTKAVIEEGITEPGRILDRARTLVRERFARSAEEVKDGMDISLCAFRPETGELLWAGANNPLWILRKGAGEMEELKGDKQPVGPSPTGHAHSFTTHRTELTAGDRIYLLSDGFVDQFGGPNGKKYKAKNLKRYLLSIRQEALEEQMGSLDREFEEWRSDQEQVDDVCMIGVKI